MGPVQRYPSGLLELLAIKGSRPPSELADVIQLTLDTLQFYSIASEQLLQSSNAALAEATAILITPSATNWTILLDVSLNAIKTATMTALRNAIAIRPNGAVTEEYALAQEELGPFGATESGAAAVIWSGYRILRPGAIVLGRMNILGTDATANCNLSVRFGVLS